MKKKIFIDNIETNYSVDTEGNIYNDKTRKIMKGTYARNEYHSVQLSINGKVKTVMTHRMVAEAFIDKIEGKDIVDHIDRNKKNNRVENLRWVSVEENNLNKERTKTKDKQLNKKVLAEEYNNFDWKEIPSLPNYYACREGFIKNSRNQIVNGSVRRGYYRLNHQPGCPSMHRLIWETFNGPIENELVIDHIDGNRGNNSLDNLRKVTQSENMFNAQNNGHSGQVKIKQYDKDGIFICEYNSIHLAAVAINGSEIAIKQAADRHGKSSGYFWIREDQDITIEDVLKEYKPQSYYTSDIVYQYDENKNFLNKYNSKKEAARAVGCADSTIARALDKNRLSKGYYWTSKEIVLENSLNAG